MVEEKKMREGCGEKRCKELPQGRYRDIIEKADVGYFEVDLEGCFTFYNRAFAEMLEYGMEDLMGRSYRVLMGEEDGKRTFRVFNSVYEGDRRVKEMPYTIHTQGGRRLRGESSIRILRDDSGRAVGFGGFTRDVTDRREAEERLRESEARYRDAYHRAEFYRDLIMHDTNNILQTVLSTAELISMVEKGKLPGDELGELAIGLERAAARGVELVETIRKLSRASSELKSAPTDVPEALKKAIDSTEKALEESGGKIFLDVPEDVPLVKAGPLIIDAFENILFNAIKYSGDGSPEVKVSVDFGEEWARVSFSDRGPGLPEHIKPALFKKKVQSEGRGMGLGMLLTAKVVKGYGGKISAESSEGSGSTFVVELDRVALD